MAVEKESLVQDEIGDKALACYVFGEGYWACPKYCPNLLASINLKTADIIEKCAIIEANLQEYTHVEVLSIGVKIRQPDIDKPFEPNPNTNI